MKIKIGKFRISIVEKLDISLSSTIAIIISWAVNKSIIWALIHYVFGIFYIIYWAISDGDWRFVLEYYRKFF